MNHSRLPSRHHFYVYTLNTYLSVVGMLLYLPKSSYSAKFVSVLNLLAAKVSKLPNFVGR
jgi:hypothetical protein